jgi:hypothetical protein
MKAGILAVLLWGLALVGGTAAAREAAASEAEVQAAAEAEPEGLFGSGFSASKFKFKTTVKDDGEGAGAGWQEASAKLNFVDGRQDPSMSWTCSVVVGMPLRTAERGTISTDWASQRSAEVATTASSTVMHRQDKWEASAFCRDWGIEMQRLLNDDKPKVGARVTGSMSRD